MTAASSASRPTGSATPSAPNNRLAVPFPGVEREVPAAPLAPGTAVRLPKGAEAQCVSCGRFFTSDSAFDGHLARLDASEPCHDPNTVVRRNRKGEVLGPKYRLIERAGGPTWGPFETDGRWAL